MRILLALALFMTLPALAQEQHSGRTPKQKIEGMAKVEKDRADRAACMKAQKAPVKHPGDVVPFDKCMKARAK